MNRRTGSHLGEMLAGILTCRPAQVSFAVVVAMMLAQQLPAQKVARPRPGGPGEWRLIGTVQAALVADHDSLLVKGPFDDFRRIKLKVTGADVEIQRLVVTYESGVPDKLEVREFIRQGGETRAIDLRGIGKRRIRRIDFWYQSRGFLKGRATVLVLGLK